MERRSGGKVEPIATALRFRIAAGDRWSAASPPNWFPQLKRWRPAAASALGRRAPPAVVPQRWQQVIRELAST